MRRRFGATALCTALLLGLMPGQADAQYDLSEFWTQPPKVYEWPEAMTADQVSHIAALGGIPPYENGNSVRVAWCESRHRYKAVNAKDRGGPALGLWQLSSWWGSEFAYPYGPNPEWIEKYGRLDKVRAVEDPVYNATYAAVILRELGWGAWGCAHVTRMG